MPFLFTHHAHERLAERLSLTTTEVSQLIEHDRAMYVGTEPLSNKQHYLFYSEPDHQWLVAVIDMDKRVVITLLPLDYHELIAWKIPQQSVDRAQRLVRGKEANYTPSGAPAQARYVVKAFCGKPNGKRKWKKAGTWAAEADADPATLCDDEAFVAQTAQGLAERGIAPHGVEGLLVQHRHTETVTMLDAAPVRDALRALRGRVGS